MLEHPKAIEIGHLHIGNDDIRRQLRNLLQAICPIHGLTDNDAVGAQPIHGEEESAADDVLILNQKNSIHLLPPI